jgi:hypothetical protein
MAALITDPVMTHFFALVMGVVFGAFGILISQMNQPAP